MKILLIDDDPDILFMAAIALEKIGKHHVIQASGGMEALQKAKQELPDAIVTDYWLEDLEGTELLKQFNSQPETQKVPVIFLTAKTEPTLIRQLLELGAKGVLAKPFDPLKLSGDIQKILAK